MLKGGEEKMDRNSAEGAVVRKCVCGLWAFDGPLNTSSGLGRLKHPLQSGLNIHSKLEPRVVSKNSSQANH